MKSIHINGVAFLSPTGNGYNASYPVNVPQGMNLHHYEGGIAMGFPGPTVGWTEALFLMAWFPAGVAPSWGNTPYAPLNIPTNADLGTPTLSQTNGGAQATQGSAAYQAGGNVLVSTILKTNAPTSVNERLDGTWGGIVVPVNSAIVVHIDGDGSEGQAPSNVEFHLTLFYE